MTNLLFSQQRPIRSGMVATIGRAAARGRVAPNPLRDGRDTDFSAAIRPSRPRARFELRSLQKARRGHISASWGHLFIRRSPRAGVCVSFPARSRPARLRFGIRSDRYPEAPVQSTRLGWPCQRVGALLAAPWDRWALLAAPRRSAQRSRWVPSALWFRLEVLREAAAGGGAVGGRRRPGSWTPAQGACGGRAEHLTFARHPVEYGVRARAASGGSGLPALLQRQAGRPGDQPAGN
jgi:hypothetical protein